MVSIVLIVVCLLLRKLRKCLNIIILEIFFRGCFNKWILFQCLRQDRLEAELLAVL